VAALRLNGVSATDIAVGVGYSVDEPVEAEASEVVGHPAYLTPANGSDSITAGRREWGRCHYESPMLVAEG